MEDVMRLHRCCFTGHRPEKLNMSEQEIKRKLEKAIDEAVKDGFTTFISGMARGVDMWAAEIVLNKRRANKKLKLICDSPYMGFERSWNFFEQCRYNSIISCADYVCFVSPGYSRGCFQVRNRHMVDNSARVISAYTGERGGTYNTIKYARKQNVEIVNILLD